MIEIKTKGKTNTYKFVPEHQTLSVKFYDYNLDTCEKKLLSNVLIDKISKNNYSLNYLDYIEKTEEIYSKDIEVKTLGQICDLKKGTVQSSKTIEGIYPLISISVNKTHNEFTDDNDNLVIAKISNSEKTKMISLYHYMHDILPFSFDIDLFCFS